ncbi:MAG: 4-(cytidine 5'-diphospho)-2-C-methyl-D-erythritol kinase [Acidobacteriota bacterium]
MDGRAVVRGIAMTTAGSLQIRCPAKINLHLEVRGRRGDGYHELRTLFAAIGVWDELVLEAIADDRLELIVEPTAAVPAGEDNLVIRAARALQRGRAPGAGARIVLRKGIPVAGGLGGGSSDAAAALVGLSSLWGLPRDFADLHPLAAELGSDVPFFLLGGVAWAVGRGTEVFPLPDLPRWWVVLLPGEDAVPTARVYAALGSHGAVGDQCSAIYHWTVAGGGLPLAACRNDLEPTVLTLWPATERRLRAVRETGPLKAMVSGSGGTVFGLYRDEATACSAAAAVGGHRTFVVPVLGRAESCLSPSAVEGEWKSQRSVST